MRTTPTSLAQDILEMYRALAGDSVIRAALKKDNLLGKRFSFLMELAAGNISLDDERPEYGIAFQEAMLDAHALQDIGGNRSTVYDSVSITDTSMFGRKSDVRPKLLGSDDEQLDWHFQNLVQAWVSSNGSIRLRDLRFDRRFKGSRVCDFAIPRPSDRFELLECKRIHIHPLNPTVDYVDVMTKKVIALLPGAIAQLQRTASILGASKCDKHLLIDISAYSNNSSFQPNRGSVEVVVRGDFQDQEIGMIGSEVNGHCGDLNKVTLCWHTVTWISGKCRAIVQRAKSLSIQPTPNELLDYKGWTIEGYPLSQKEYRVFRVSTVARSIDWIVTSFNNTSDPQGFWELGFEKIVGDQ